MGMVLFSRVGVFRLQLLCCFRNVLYVSSKLESSEACLIYSAMGEITIHLMLLGSYTHQLTFI